MQTQCHESRMEFHGLGERVLTAGFDGGKIVSGGGVPLLAEVDRMFRVSAVRGLFYRSSRSPTERTFRARSGQAKDLWTLLGVRRFE